MTNYDDPEGIYKRVHDHGGMSRWAYEDDPKRLAFTLARYKHTAKLLAGYDEVLEVGCADGFASRIVAQHVGKLTATDLDPQSIAEAKANMSEKWPINFEVASIDQIEPGSFDAVYALDVLEHIKDYHKFLINLAQIAPIAVIGIPSAESQVYASELSKQGHVSCQTGQLFKRNLLMHYEHVFVFTMHDETLGTSFYPMAHYLLALCVR